IQGANDAAAISGSSSASLGEDAAAPATGTLTVSDVDDGEAYTQLASGSGASNLGTYSVDADGHWSYALNNAAVQHLGAGATATDSFIVTSQDGSAAQTVTITIQGANDAAAISGSSSASLGEDAAAPAADTPAVSDVDDGEAHTHLASARGARNLHSFPTRRSSDLSYALNNAAVQHLGAGATATDSFIVTSQDGSAAQTVTITIQGANDAAAISGSSSASLGEDAA